MVFDTITRSLPLLSQIKNNQWKSREELESIQFQKLKELISYARQYVPHYRKHLKHLPLNSLDDHTNLPIVKKTDVFRNPLSFISTLFDPSSLSSNSTSGSSGIPLTIFQNSTESHFGPVLEVHQLTEAGISPFDLQVHITHNATKPRFIQKLGIFRRGYISMYSSSDDKIKALTKMRPSAVLSFPSVLVPIARRILETRTILNIRKIFSYGEILDADTRGLLNRAFGCRIYDWYGTMEGSWTAWECEKGSLHLNSDNLLMEIVDDNGHPVKRGDVGNVVITPLWRRAMLFIRYSVGDIAAFASECDCGRGLHAIRPVEGRGDDFITLQDGSKLSPRVLPCSLAGLKGVGQFQIIQKSVDHFVFRYAQAKDFTPQVVTDIFKQHLGESIILEFEENDGFERSKTGKFKKVISNVR